MTTPFGKHGWEQLSLEQQVQELFKHMPPANEAEAEQMIAAVIKTRNETPQDDFGGLTPHQVCDLLSGDWEPTTPGVRLRTAIPAALVAETSAVNRAEFFLVSLGDQGTPATAKGNLNRKFVARMVAELDFDEDLVGFLRECCKVFNEYDVPPLEELRLVLEIAGLVRKYRKRFVITKKGRELMAVERAGDLYRLLLLTWCQRFNLGFGDRLPELYDFQLTMGFGLCQLGRLPNGWHALDERAPDLMLPSVRQLVPQVPYMDLGVFLVRRRLLEVMELFGLVEFREKAMEGESEAQSGIKPLEFRRTALFGEVFGFSG